MNVNKQIFNALNRDANKCRIFNNALVNYSNGRGILHIPMDILYQLTKNTKTKTEALTKLFNTEHNNLLNFAGIKPYYINILAEEMYNNILTGIDLIIKNLDINSYVTIDKIIKTSKFYNTSDIVNECGGNLIKNYITYATLKSNINKDIPKENFKIIRHKLKEFSQNITFKSIQSLPFAMARYSKSIRILNNIIIIPDIEAKWNIKKIIGKDLYDELLITNISLDQATRLENILIEKIISLVKEQIDECKNEINISITNEMAKKHLLASTDFSSITAITRRGTFKDIVDTIKRHISVVNNLLANPNNIIDLEFRKDLIQIELVAQKYFAEFPMVEELKLAEFRDIMQTEDITFNTVLETWD